MACLLASTWYTAGVITKRATSINSDRATLNTTMLAKAIWSLCVLLRWSLSIMDSLKALRTYRKPLVCK